jgi:hypothetical protein
MYDPHDRLHACSPPKEAKRLASWRLGTAAGLGRVRRSKRDNSNHGNETAPQNQVAPILPHAEERWEDRTDAPCPLREAWQQGLRVNAPEVDGEEARLYSPLDALIVKRDGVMRTVLNADYRRLDANGYIQCESCDHLADPLDGECRWCGSSLGGGGGGIVIRQGGQ